jgi:hypothetical protein
MVAFGPATLHIALPIRLIRGLPDTPDGSFEPHPADAGTLELCVDLAAGLRIQVPGLSDHGFSDPFTELSSRELAVGVGQLKAQCPGGVEPPRRNHRGDPAGQSDLFGNAAANRGGMHISGQLLSDLGLGEPHRLRRLQCRCGRPEFLQKRNTINSNRIRGQSVIRNSGSKIGQHRIQTRHQRVG